MSRLNSESESRRKTSFGTNTGKSDPVRETITRKSRVGRGTIVHSFVLNQYT